MGGPKAFPALLHRLNSALDIFPRLSVLNQALSSRHHVLGSRPVRLHFSLGILVQECGLLHCRHIAVYKGTTTEMFLFGEPRQLFLVILDELVQRTGLVQIQTTLSTQIDECVVLRSDVVEFSLKNVVLLPLFLMYLFAWLVTLVSQVP